MIEADYLWDGRVRWNLWFANPNHAGAFVAVLLPWCWAVAAQGWLRAEAWRARSVVALAMTCELALWWTLCMTCSRGAMVGALAAAGVFAASRVAAGTEGNGAGRRQVWLGGAEFLASRLAVAVALAWASGFAGRIDPGYVAGDASAGNRIELWLGGLRMLAASPWDGWGAGASGHAYMQFFQPLESDAAYATMVNSWLTMGVERGVVVFGGALLVAGLLVLAGWRRAARGADAGARLAACATASLAAFCVASVFSSLREVGWLWAGVAPALAMLAGCLGCGLCVGWWRVARDAAVTACVVVAACLGLVAVGSRLPGDVRVRVAEGAVVLTAAKEAAGRGGRKKSLGFYPDEDVLGRLHGREARRLLMADKTIKELCMGSAAGVDAALLFGREAQRVADLSVDCIFVHPMADAARLTEEAWERVRAVVVPELDWSADADRWRAEVERRGLPLIESPGVGTDIRAAWPAVGVGVL